MCDEYDEYDEWAPAEPTEPAADRATLERRLRHHLFALCDAGNADGGDWHALSLRLVREAATVFGPCQSDAEYQRVADYCAMLASEFRAPPL